MPEFPLPRRSDKSALRIPASPGAQQLCYAIRFQELRYNHCPVVSRSWPTAEFIQLTNERQQIFPFHILDVALRAVAREEFQAILVSYVGLGLALRRLPVLDVGRDRLGDSRPSPASVFLNGFHP